MAHTEAQLTAWIFQRFATDSDQPRLVRVMAVERMLLDAYGFFHAPDKNGEPCYFGMGIDAKVQRSRMAQRIVDEQDWRENYALITGAAHENVLPSLRDVAERQREILERTGLLVSGFDREVA